MIQNAQRTAMSFLHPRSKLGAAVQTLSLILLFEILEFLAISVVFSIPLQRLRLPFVLYFISFCVGVPLIFNARRFLDRPKQCAVWFAVAIFVFCFFVMIATIYSGILLGLAETSKYMAFGAVFGCPIAAVSGYYTTLHRLTSKQA